MLRRKLLLTPPASHREFSRSAAAEASNEHRLGEFSAGDEVDKASLLFAFFKQAASPPACKWRPVSRHGTYCKNRRCARFTTFLIPRDRESRLSVSARSGTRRGA